MLVERQSLYRGKQSAVVQSEYLWRGASGYRCLLRRNLWVAVFGDIEFATVPRSATHKPGHTLAAHADRVNRGEKTVEA